MKSDKELTETIESGTNAIIARFLVLMFGVVSIVMVLTFTRVFIIQMKQGLTLFVVEVPSAIYGIMVLAGKRIRYESRTKVILCILLTLQAIAVAVAGYSFVCTIVLLIPILLSSFYPNSKLGVIVSAVMVICGFILPPLTLMTGLWNGGYYEYLYDLANAREMYTATLSDVMLTKQEQINSAIRFCSSQNVLIIGGFSIIGRLIYKQANQSFESQKDVIRLSETDELTGLLNRNCFERRLNELAAFNAPGAVCFYFDVNGLHEVNNTNGHKAGDSMLQFVGKKIQDVFGENNTFRIGGDEYVAFSAVLESKSLSDVKSSLEDVFASHGYHVAIGYARSEAVTTSANDLVQQAEKEMYQAKAMYYITHERRRD